MKRRYSWMVGLVVGFGQASMGFGADDDLGKELPRIPASAPAEALAALKVRPGFQVKLAATEPQVSDPVAACFDADGRLYVVEMRGYPYPESQPSGNVSVLEDGNGDGVFDKSTIFLDGLSWPTSVVPYDGGVFIAVAPDIVYAKDTDGDGKADVRKVMFSGFGTGNVQALLNGLLWGTDGWIYGAAAANGGTIRNASRPDAPPVALRSRDFRFRPDGSAFEAISGGGQFGHTVDDWGHRFVCNNSNHIRQVVLPSRYLDRVPALAAPAAVVDIAAEGPASPVYRISPAEPWRVVRTRQRLADPALAAKLPATERLVIGYFTSATGVTLYRGSAFPPEYKGNAFVGDVGGNLVHRKTMAPDGPIFQATRAEPDRKDEFLASPDNWFRPVNFAGTPSGTLLILDMYRETIEHPFSIPEPIKKHLDLTSGKDRGRLYELMPDGFTARRPAPRLSQAPTAELVTLLADPDAWWRDTAQRLLIERNDDAALPLLRALARDRPTALARAHACWTLDALGHLDVADLLPAFTDPEPGVREQAAKLSEPKLATSPELREALIKLAEDPSPMVRFQTAFSLGECPGEGAADALVAIATQDRSSPWTRWAVLSSIGDRTRFNPFFLALARVPGFAASPDGREWIEDLAALIGSGKGPGTTRDLHDLLIAKSTNSAARRAMAIGYARLLRQSIGSFDGFLGEIAEALAPLSNTARSQAVDDAAPVPDRVDAIRFLAIGPKATSLEVLPTLLEGRQPGEVQLAALRALAGFSDRAVAETIVSRWNTLSPSVRREAAEVVFARPARLNVLLDAIEAKTLAPGDVEPARRKALLAHKDLALRSRATALLGPDPGADRARVIASLQGTLKLAGERDRGKAVFLKACAACHKAEAQGEDVGPDLATVSGRSPEDLLIHVLDPNREVAPQYLNYSIATKDGRVVTGLIATESAGSVTLKRGGGVMDVVPRPQIEAITSNGSSLMPEGLETGLAPEDLAGLIVYLRTLQPK